MEIDIIPSNSEYFETVGSRLCTVSLSKKSSASGPQKLLVAFAIQTRTSWSKLLIDSEGTLKTLLSKARQPQVCMCVSCVHLHVRRRMK